MILSRLLFVGVVGGGIPTAQWCQRVCMRIPLVLNLRQSCMFSSSLNGKRNEYLTFKKCMQRTKMCLSTKLTLPKAPFRGQHDHCLVGLQSALDKSCRVPCMG